MKKIEDILRSIYAMGSRDRMAIQEVGIDKVSKDREVSIQQALSEIQALVPKKEKTVKFISTVRNDTIDEMLENMGLRED